MLVRHHIPIIYFLISLFAVVLAADPAHAAAVKITQTSIPTPTQFAAYSTTLNATGGAGVYTWSISAGTLPNGLYLDPSTCLSASAACNILGTPTVSGAYNFTVTATEATTPPPPPKSGAQQFIGTITPNCRMFGSTEGLYFGTLSGGSGNVDPSTSPPITSTVTTPITFQCGTGLNYTISVVSPLPPLSMTGANTINFTIGVTASGSGNDGMPATPLVINNASTIDNFSKNFYAGTSSIGPVTLQLSWSGSASGFLNSTLNIYPVNIIDTCSTPANGSINFTIDPSSAGPITPNTTANGTAPTVMCTNGQPHGVSCTSSHAYMLTIGNDGSTDPIAYTITGCPASVSGQGFLTATPINFGLSLAAANYQNALAGAHSDTITVTVMY